ncbi:hypothetical protein [Streptomyces sp. R33]|uniref:Uncharacterized protein n=1 Tax=Streptomyces sp. R33 TaxID=3238629 RepID=A0AB39YHF8_9ACTN
MANELKYGDAVTLQNGFASWTGGYLEVNGPGPSSPGYEVDTASTATCEGLSGTWKIASASGKADGATVTSGDLVFLVSQYNNSTPSYLDVSGGAGYNSGKYSVSASGKQNREGYSGEWFLFAETSSTQDGAIRTGDVVHILSNYGTANGGWLEIMGGAPAPATGLHGVYTNAYANRDNGSGSWRFARA